MLVLPRTFTPEESRELAYCYTEAIPLAGQMYGAFDRATAERGPQVIDEYCPLLESDASGSPSERYLAGLAQQGKSDAASPTRPDREPYGPSDPS
jgi:hypothetical protein